MKRAKSRSRASGKSAANMSLQDMFRFLHCETSATGTMFYTLAKRALDFGENFLAYDLAERIHSKRPAALLEKTRIQALALARSGSLTRAAELVRTLPDVDDTEIVGLKGRIYKDMAVACANPRKRRELFRLSADTNLGIFRKKPQYYNGINAATCFYMAGDVATARNLVSKSVLPMCRAEPDDLWRSATLGECSILLGDDKSALTYYKQSVDRAGREGMLGSLSSILRQLHILASVKRSHAGRILSALELPAVAVFSGHVIDEDGRADERFPASAIPTVSAHIRQTLTDGGIRVAYSSCACGSDIIFIEELVRLGGECHIVPPFPIETTIHKCVNIAPGDWERRLKKALKSPHVHLHDPECDETGERSDDAAYGFANRRILGMALLKAKASYLPVRGICVWDREDSGLTGNTASAVALWKANRIPTTIISPKE